MARTPQIVAVTSQPVLDPHGGGCDLTIVTIRDAAHSPRKLSSCTPAPLRRLQWGRDRAALPGRPRADDESQAGEQPRIAGVLRRVWRYCDEFDGAW